MRIAEIREIINILNWSRQNATGGTREENQRCNLPARLEPLIAEVEALQIPPRHRRDIENRNQALTHARDALARWSDNRTA